MGTCNSTQNSSKKKNSSSHHKKSSNFNQQIIQPAFPNSVSHSDDVEPKTNKIPNTTRSPIPAVALSNDVFISRNDVNPEFIYKKIKKLGIGGFGEVWLVKHKDLNSEYAMKIINKRSNKPSEEKEIMIRIIMNILFNKM